MNTPLEFNTFIRDHTLHIRHSISNLVLNTGSSLIRSMIHEHMKREAMTRIVLCNAKETVNTYGTDFDLHTVVMTPDELNQVIDFAYREGTRKVNYNMDLK